jgi:hypothetical protein
MSPILPEQTSKTTWDDAATRTRPARCRGSPQVPEWGGDIGWPTVCSPSVVACARPRAGDADGRGGHAEIAHAHIATLLEFVEIGDEGIGLHDIGPSRTGRLSALAIALFCLLLRGDCSGVSATGDLPERSSGIANCGSQTFVLIRNSSLVVRICRIRSRRRPVTCARLVPSRTSGLGCGSPFLFDRVKKLGAHLAEDGAELVSVEADVRGARRSIRPGMTDLTAPMTRPRSRHRSRRLRAGRARLCATTAMPRRRWRQPPQRSARRRQRSRTQPIGRPGSLYGAAPVLADLRLNQLPKVRLEPLMRPFLIRPHQARIPRHVGGGSDRYSLPPDGSCR